MRVKSIVLDGFKSYAHRKALDDLSSHFNAITGLNGSGKSNIFDAICFVMGITNLKRVRAEDPRELIFRAGTTGVHAARVTIEFINDDSRTAPPGYSCEEYPIITVGRQIKLGGKQQFFLNNTVSMQSKVKRFFESISLNVDNPHFMVLQGTVHKLIGMRSQDILSLIEEAVGTKAFDHRRRTAESLIRGKEKKMQEIDDNIQTQIGPMLSAMKADQDEYERFMRVSEGIETKRRFRVAFEYEEHRSQLEQRRARRSTLETDAADAREQLRALPASEDDATRRLMRYQSSLEAAAAAAVALHEEEAARRLQTARDAAQAEAAAQSRKSLEAAARRAERERAQAETRVRDCAARRAQRADLLARVQAAREEAARLRRALQLQQSGVRAGASGRPIAEERAELERQAVHSAAERQRAAERTDVLRGQLGAAVTGAAARRAELERLESAHAAAASAAECAARECGEALQLDGRLRALREEATRLQTAHREALDAIRRDGGAAGGGFDVPFDRRALPEAEAEIVGRVAELVAAREERFGIALSVGAFQQLMRVVVTTDRAAERLITRGGLRQRTSFLPLNALQVPRGIDPSRLAAAEEIAARSGGFVAVAKDLIDVTDSAHRAVADAVFGQFLVCSNLALAQDLAYSPAVRCKAVSLDGDVAEPSGLLTGGATQQLRDVLAEARAHRTRRAPVDALRQRVAETEAACSAARAEWERHAGPLARHAAAVEAVGVAAHRLRLAREECDTPSAELREALAAAEGRLADATAALADLSERRAELDRLTGEDPEEARRALQTALDEANERHATLAREEAEGAAEFERLDAETTQLAADLERKAAEARAELAQRATAEEAEATRRAEAAERLRDAEKRRAEAEQRREGLEREVEETQQELQQLVVRKASLEGVVKNAEVDLREAGRAVDELHRAVAEAERRHPWIVEERVTFGAIDGPYYFADKERTATTLQELREAESQAAVMSKRLNRRATILYEERRREYDELVQQRSALGEDRDAIQQCILGIESKKWQALDRMVRVVSSVFSKLFSTCLPGAAAELREERDEQQHLSGLQVRVMFNGKEKESLSELSGGQRSLLALCLILAILRVRQAPMYILDEVDAALDPSHTQNIGRMLQTHFPTSQFLLVSLKDGMFNNADVLYQVSNTQGYSEIVRIEAAGKHS